MKHLKIFNSFDDFLKNQLSLVKPWVIISNKGISFSDSTELVPPSNEIWYITYDETVYTLWDILNDIDNGDDWIGDTPWENMYEIVSNTYENGIGRIVFKDPVTALGMDDLTDDDKIFFYPSFGDYNNPDYTNIKAIILPDSVNTLYAESICELKNLDYIIMPNNISIKTDALYNISFLPTSTFVIPAVYDIPEEPGVLLNNIYAGTCIMNDINTANLSYITTDTLIIEENINLQLLKAQMLQVNNKVVCKTLYVDLSKLNSGYGIVELINTVELSDYCFQRNTNSPISLINFPNTLKKIGAYILWDHTITDINIPKSVTSISYNAFHFISTLESIKVDSKNTIYDSRNNCNALIETATDTLFLASNNTTYIPSTIKRITSEAFMYTLLDDKQLLVDPKNTIYDSRNNCNALIETATDTLIKGNNLTTIPEDIFCIWYYAFAYSHLINLHISQKIYDIKLYAFYNTTIDNIIVDEENEYYESKNNCLIIKNYKGHSILLAAGKNFSIPDDVEYVYENAFNTYNINGYLKIPHTYKGCYKWGYENEFEDNVIKIYETVMNTLEYDNNIPFNNNNILLYGTTDNITTYIFGPHTTELNYNRIGTSHITVEILNPNIILTKFTSTIPPLRLNINYNGTIEQWNNMEKNPKWNNITRNIYATGIINCIDGTLNI